MYDIVEYAETGSLSDRLRGELPGLLVRPLSQDMLLLQLTAISKLRYDKGSSSLCVVDFTLRFCFPLLSFFFKTSSLSTPHTSTPLVIPHH